MIGCSLEKKAFRKLILPLLLLISSFGSELPTSIRQLHKIESWKFSAVSSSPDPQGGIQRINIDTALLPLGGRGGMKQRKISKIQFYAIALVDIINY